MPLYTYECKKCHALIQDHYQLITEKDLTQCPACGGKLIKIISKCWFVLKGDRWAKDGYSNKPSPPCQTTGRQETNKPTKQPTKQQAGKPAGKRGAYANGYKG